LRREGETTKLNFSIKEEEVNQRKMSSIQEIKEEKEGEFYVMEGTLHNSVLNVMM